MNIREKRKKDRIELLKKLMLKERDKEILVSIMIVNHAITKKTALEEIEAVEIYLDAQ